MKKLFTPCILFTFLILSICLCSSQANAQRAYITNKIDNTVSVIDVATNSVIATIPVGASPQGVAVSNDGSKVYIAYSDDYTMSVIDVVTNTVSDTIQFGYPYTFSCIAVSPDDKKIYYGGEIGSAIAGIGSINTATNTISASIMPGNSLEEFKGISVSPDGSKVYVDGNSGNVYVIDSALDTVLATIPVGSFLSGTPYGIAVSPDGSKVFVTIYNFIGMPNYGNTVVVINTATNTVSNTITVGNGPHGIAMSPDGSMVYVSNYIANSISVINTTTGTVLVTIPVGSAPEGVSVTPDGSKVFVANRNSNTVSVINTATNTVMATIPVGNTPIAFGNFISKYSLTPTVNISASQNPMCPGTSTNLIAYGTATYSWSNSLGTSNIVTVSPTTTTTYTVTGTTLGHTGTASITITIASLPSGAGTISGTAVVCQGQDSVTYTVPAINNATSYVWNLPNGASGTSTTNSISVNYGTSALSGNVTVAGHNTCGNGIVSNFPVYVVPLPVTNAGNDTLICPGSSIILAATNGNSYIWNNGVTQGVPFVPTSTKTYTVTVSNGFCSTTDSVTVAIAIPPSATVIYQVGDDLYSTTSTGNQWYFNNVAIGGATSPIYTTFTSGTFYSIITDTLGCASDTSNVLYVVTTGLPNISDNENINIYPNPATETITFEFPQKATLEIFNMQGKLIRTIVTESNKTSIDISTFPCGMYFVKGITEQGIAIRKFIKE